jgi:hypothetical protein
MHSRQAHGADLFDIRLELCDGKLVVPVCRTVVFIRRGYAWRRRLRQAEWTTGRICSREAATALSHAWDSYPGDGAQRSRGSGRSAARPSRQAALARGFRLWHVAFINRNFALLWWGQAISSIGDYVWDTALVLWIATTLANGQSWAPLAVSGAILAAAIPQIVVGPIAGVFVDRLDKRETMIAMTAIQALLAALLIVPVTGLTCPASVTHIFRQAGSSASHALTSFCLQAIPSSSCQRSLP